MKTVILFLNSGILFAALTTGLGQSATNQFNSVYAFGFSWTDTRGLRPDGTICGWDTPDYYGHRASNGRMWPEFLSTNAGLIYVPTNNYARCGATSGDVLTQVSQLKTSTNVDRGLFFIWEAGGDFLYAADLNYSSPSGDVSYVDWTDEAGCNTVIQQALTNSFKAVDQLHAKGARSIAIQNLLDLSLTPGIIQDFDVNTNRLRKLKERTTQFNSELVTTLQSVQQAKADLRLCIVDVCSRLSEVYADPVRYGLTKVFPDALDDPGLTDKAFTGAGQDYMFWDLLHGTSKLHKLIADWNLEALTNSIPETLEVTITGGLPNIQMNRLLIGRDYTLQKSTELKTWTDVQSFTASAGTNQWPVTIQKELYAYFRLKWER